jgi:MFS family permease
VITGYGLAAAVALALVGPMGNRFGRRRMLLASLGAFVVGAVVCATADDIGVLIAGRIIQGLGAGAGVLGVAIATDNLAPAEVPRALGLFVGGVGIGGAIGLLASGLLVDHVSTAAVFWVAGGLATATALAAWLFVQEVRFTTTNASTSWERGSWRRRWRC